VLEHGRIVANFDVVRRMDRKIGVKFRLVPEVRRGLIVKIFTGSYNQDVEEISPPEVIKALARAAVSWAFWADAFSQPASAETQAQMW
jgi:hypothetical protein